MVYSGCNDLQISLKVIGYVIHYHSSMFLSCIVAEMLVKANI